MRAIVFLFLSLAGAVSAAETRLVFDAAQSSVDFTLADVLHTVHGNFKLKQGELRFDPATSMVTGEITVDATSGQSGSNARDSRMHKNILESMRFPDVLFLPARFTGEFHPQEDSQLTVHGTFRLHGTDHEIDMPVKVHPEQGGYMFDAQFPVPYVAWGLKNPSTFLLKVGDTVTITLHAAARTISVP